MSYTCISNVDLWKLKTGRTVEEDISGKDCVIRGVALEPLLREIYARLNPDVTVNHDDYTLVRHPKYDYLLATLDGIITGPDGKRGILEIKTCQLNGYNYVDWQNRIPDNYYCQILHYLLVTGFDYAVVFALLLGREQHSIKTYRFEARERKREIIYLKEKEIEFWEEYVLEDREPPLILPKI
ncbi:MAG: YqaJ viral recombinase family protein [Rickettsiales bacterium]|jgi:predicted phage-related endonuclease|nr:YqaJ viral recombinase family protein [Rickettsiales bacterium]